MQLLFFVFACVKIKTKMGVYETMEEATNVYEFVTTTFST